MTGIRACCGRSTVVDLLLVGVMKSGTSSLGAIVGTPPHLCHSRYGEVHFFDDDLSADPASQAQVRSYQERAWGQCNSHWPRFEKSPNYFLQEFTPLRICEALGPRQKILIILREPGARTFSEFAQHVSKKRYDGTGIHATPAGFDTLVKVELAISRQCNATPGPYYSPEHIPPGVLEPWQQCCKRVVQQTAHGISEKICQCKQPGVRIEGLAWCHAFGAQALTPVRSSVYDVHIRKWLRYFYSSNLMIFRAEDLFAHMEVMVAQLLDFSLPNYVVSSRIKELHSNSQSKKLPPMYESTRVLLTEFFAPHNARLEALIGREMHWPKP